MQIPQIEIVPPLLGMIPDNWSCLPMVLILTFAITCSTIEVHHCLLQLAQQMAKALAKFYLVILPYAFNMDLAMVSATIPAIQQGLW